MQKVYLIMGATSDIGVELLHRIYNTNDIFICQGSNDLEILKEFSKDKNNINLYDINLTDNSCLDKFIDEITLKYPTPTHYVHLPALRVINTKFKKFDEDRFNLDMNVQVTSAIRISKTILPKMAKNKYGRCLFMLTSYLLGMPPKNTTSYIVSKSALQGLVKSLAIDYASFGITVNAVAPSMMVTKFLTDLNPIIVEAAALENPMKRNATVNDVAPAMQFLLSDEAGFITGVTLPITGGESI